MLAARQLAPLLAAEIYLRRSGLGDPILFDTNDPVHSPLENGIGVPPNALTRQVRARLAGSGFDILDLYPDVAAAAAKDYGIHLNIGGHRFHADWIAAKLQPFVAGTADSGRSSGLAIRNSLFVLRIRGTAAFAYRQALTGRRCLRCRPSCGSGFPNGGNLSQH